MSVSLNKEAYLGVFSYMPLLECKDCCPLVAIKAISYIPVLGTISCIFFSVHFIRSAAQEENGLKRQVCWLVGNYFILRAVLSLAPPLLLAVELVSTVAGAIISRADVLKIGDHYWIGQDPMHMKPYI
ncbi:MAG: hypothetical protein ACSNEK_03655 [Parachlamydiaceae bacterium]